MWRRRFVLVLKFKLQLKSQQSLQCRDTRSSSRSYSLNFWILANALYAVKFWGHDASFHELRPKPDAMRPKQKPTNLASRPHRSSSFNIRVLLWRWSLLCMRCLDIDECAEQQVQCPANQKCFNNRGGYECVDTTCPPNYDRDPNTGYSMHTAPFCLH